LHGQRRVPMEQCVSVSESITPSAHAHDLSRVATRRRQRRDALTAARQRAKRIDGVRLVACLDSLAAVAAISLVLILVNLHSMPSGIDSFLSARITVKNLLLLVFLATAWPAVFGVCGLYDAGHVRRLRSEVIRLVLAVTAGSALALIVPLTSVSRSVTVANLGHFWVASLALGLLVRAGRRAVDRAHHPHVRQMLIVGTGRLAERVYQDIEASRSEGYEVVGFLDEPTNGKGDAGRLAKQTIGTLDDLEQILMRQVVDEVMIALPVKSRYHQIQEVIGVCGRLGVRAKYGAELFESTFASPRYDGDGEQAFVAMQVAPEGFGLVVKRAVDLVGATLAVVLLAPVFLAVAAAIKLTSVGPIIYAQDRCGLRNRPFRMYKFRSMRVDADKLQSELEARNEASGPVFKIRNDPRITPLGRLLRRSSLDELPQLWNVLRGEMSLVGPRPLPRRDVSRITRPADMRRFSMRPGLTCLWQVQGRSNLDFERWVELDVEYIDTWSLTLDCRILLKTVPAVLSGKGAT
jgi:exopolysaccharide biosynthesis polyprenyl glycosylphosphotransferase